MKLDTYDFEYDPERFTPPRAKVSNASLETYTGVAYFSWGSKIIGQKILLEWDNMTLDQFNNLDAIYIADAEVEWDPEITHKILHGAVTNGPFVTGKTVTGNESAATGTVIGVDLPDSFIEITPLTGTFVKGESFHDNSNPQKSATIKSYENVGKFNVQVLDLQGSYVENVGPTIAYRKDVRMELLILSEV